MGLQPFYGKGPHLLLLAGSWTTCGKITVNGIPNHLNYCVIFMVYSQFKMWQSGGPQVEAFSLMFSIILFLPLSAPDILTDFCYYHSCIHCSQIYYSTTHYSGCEEGAWRHLNRTAHATCKQIVTGSTYGCLCITSPIMLHKQNTRTH
jgi:hypothetical protein